MESTKPNRISKSDFLKLNEEDILFITNPGRMGDEDGITFVVSQDNEFIMYRIDGWMYPDRNANENMRITLEDAIKQFPMWNKAWKHGSEKDYDGKYKYVYMGFGNGLSIDNSIYNEYEPFLNSFVDEYLASKETDDKEGLRYAAVFNVWEKALIKMAEEKNITLVI